MTLGASAVVTLSAAEPAAPVARREAAQGNVRPVEPAALGDWMELLARIGHDLRTPLNAVIGFSDAMQNELFGPLGNVRYQEYARHIRQSGDLLLRAAEDTLAVTAILADPRSAVMEDLALAPLVRAAVATIAMGSHGDVLGSGVIVDLEVEEAAMVRGDARVLPRALGSLLTSALAGAVRGDRLTIAAHGEHGRVALTITVRTSVVQPVRQHAGERGLGREDLSVWLARSLLDLQGAALVTRAGADTQVMIVDFEQATQSDLWSSRA